VELSDPEGHKTKGPGSPIKSSPLLEARQSLRAKSEKWLDWKDNSKWLLLMLLHSGVASLLALLMDYGIELIEQVHEYFTELVHSICK
jgi:hypothetical protein